MYLRISKQLAGIAFVSFYVIGDEYLELADTVSEGARCPPTLPLRLVLEASKVWRTFPWGEPAWLAGAPQQLSLST